MKTLIRLVQFILSEIAELCSLISLAIMAIGFYTILPILVFFALLAFIFAGNWSWLLGVLIYVLIACAVFLIFKAIPEFLNFILGILLNERGENKKIYQKYEQWFESARNQEYERRKKAQEKYQKQQDREKQHWKEKSQEYSYYRHQQEYSREQYERKNNDYSNFDYQSTNDGEIIQKFEEYLAVLKIDKNGEINDNVIKKAYRKKMKEVHPDKNSNIDATAQSQKINAINEFLKEQLEYYLIQRRKG
ncbi:DnaJ domain-containing protein [Leptotrichia wadei]|uniref:DnaJ domain protein n=1 Tax=Leptotrichia wadei TaxID=157687 RepID=A0A510KCB4_9FUSO|nr:DnaJ domain-containing protein [Leptotrichia wadei]BBM49316.1 DnaJ domain protein [Leptotrichia wadei]